MNARDLTLVEIDARKLPGWPSHRLPDRVRAGRRPDDPRDLALAEHITLGVITNLLHLRHLLHHHSGRPLKQIEPLVAKIAVIALYQLRFMQKIPASAAVDEAVEQTRRFGRSSAAGFMNAILRNATRNPDPQPPDSRRDPQGYASLVLSHPAELYRRLTEVVRPGDEALAQCARNNREPPTIVRVFNGISIEQLAAPDVTITPHAQSGMYVVDGAKRATLEGWAQRGVAQVQDATSAKAVSYMDIHPGQRLLDRCSGLGTKTLQMRDEVGADGHIVAIDPSPARMTGLRRMLDARGITNISTHQIAMLHGLPSIARDSFDRVLLDVPCSNSGVLSRRAEARYAQDDRTIESLVKLQREILLDTAAYVAAGGLIVYSTCTIWPDENERQIQWFVQQRDDYELVDSRLTLPSVDDDPRRYHDGGFVAVLRRARQPRVNLPHTIRR